MPSLESSTLSRTESLYRIEPQDAESKPESQPRIIVHEQDIKLAAKHLADRSAARSGFQTHGRRRFQDKVFEAAHGAVKTRNAGDHMHSNRN